MFLLAIPPSHSHHCSSSLQAWVLLWPVLSSYCYVSFVHLGCRDRRASCSKSGKGHDRTCGCAALAQESAQAEARHQEAARPHTLTHDASRPTSRHAQSAATLVEASRPSTRRRRLSTASDFPMATEAPRSPWQMHARTRTSRIGPVTAHFRCPFSTRASRAAALRRCTTHAIRP